MLSKRIMEPRLVTVSPKRRQIPFSPWWLPNHAAGTLKALVSPSNTLHYEHKPLSDYITDISDICVVMMRSTMTRMAKKTVMWRMTRHSLPVLRQFLLSLMAF